MRKSLPLLFTFASSAILSLTASAQSSDRFAYAVTDAGQGPYWTFLRKLDLQTGNFSDILLDGNNAKQVAYSVATKKEITTYALGKGMGFNEQPAFSSSVAAMAYDKRHDRLYYTPMFIDQLRYVDLKTMKVFYADDRVFSGRPQKSPDQGNIVTRMVIAEDGNGYAITNDGTQLLRFSTDKKMQIEDLGSLTDAQSNKGVSIHNSCSSFGGDVIADDKGGLYIFSARNHVFRVDIESKVATHLGAVNGLPAGFTINGAVVTPENKIVVSTANNAVSYFTIDLKALTAEVYNLQGRVWQSSDMANSNLYVTAPKTNNTPIDLGRGVISETNSGDGKVSVYPNPVTDNRFAMQFNALKAGAYTIQITDIMGKLVQQQNITIGGENHTQQVVLSRGAAKGMYLVKVLDGENQTVYTTKVILQ